jgi:multidrug efflux pump subunit AcrA (membrane-fusion protein)
MSEASHHDSPEAVHYNLPDDRIKSRGASLGLSLLSIILAISAGGLAFKLRQQDDAVDNLRAQLERANSETAAAQADLTKTGSAMSDLHGLVDKAQKQAADAQAQTKKIEEAGAQTQAQLQQAQAELQSQQQKSQAQIADLQTRLNRANDSSSGLRNELATVKKQNDDLKALLAKASEKPATPSPAAVAGRTLPLTTEFKKSFFADGFTLTLKNTGSTPLKLDLEIVGSPNTPSKSVTIEGGGTLELKDLAAGATVGIASDGFTPISLKAK